MNAVRELQAQFKAKTVNKRYHALVQGSWPAELLEIDAPLQRVLGGSRERFVRVSKEGKLSKTSFAVLERFSVVTLLEARPQTGRTHQIRVHCQYAGHPILGDEKYAQNSGNVPKNPQAEAKYLCLHAAEITFKRPGSEASLTVQAPWDKTFAAQVARMRKKLFNSD
jgi:23S rRNA pseudouridine955/2504/2580 synthase